MLEEKFCARIVARAGKNGLMVIKQSKVYNLLQRFLKKKSNFFYMKIKIKITSRRFYLLLKIVAKLI
jgi:hypothetical protein